MDKKAILDKYKNTEDKLLISKFFDKVESSITKSRIEITDFYNDHEQVIINRVINIGNVKNCIFHGGINTSVRKLCILYPDKLSQIFENGNFKFDTVFSVFRILLSKDDCNKFNHGVYLGGIIKLGLSRAKIGDIIVYDNGADIIVKKECEKFLFSNLKTLNRFSNSDVELIKLCEINEILQNFEDIKIITSSLRIDNIISELVKTSRNKVSMLLDQERVFVNYDNKFKATKQVKVKDIITIRGKGKFIIYEIVGNTKKGNYIINAKKYV